MSLIMDALEKVQRETKPLRPVAEFPGATDRPKAVAAPREELYKGVEREAVPAQRRHGIFVLGFAVFLFASAMIGFQKISAGLSLPQVQESSAAALRTGTVPAALSHESPGVLRGVLLDPAGSFCILGDQILKTGDTWRGYTVLSIEAQQVVVQDTQNRLLTLHLQES